MTAEQFLNQPNLDAAVFFVYGEERYLIDSVKDAVIRGMGVDLMNMDVREEKVTVDEVISITQQMPCFAEHRLLILNDPDLLKSADGEKLAEYLPNMRETAKLMILLHSAPDKRRAIYKYLSKNAFVIEAEKLKAADLSGWIVKTAKRFGIQMDMKTAQFLTEFSGEDMLTLKGELEKLAMLGKQKITAADIEAIASATPDYNVFKIHNCMIEKKYREAFLLTKKEFQAQKSYIPLIALLANKFNQMYMTKNCLLSGMSRQQAADTVAKSARISPFAAKHAAQECEGFTMEQLKEALRMLEDYEFALKFGGANEGIESILCKIYAIS
ncbi:MAG: DNA polymerase III subunit delta [Christensenellaceae bacterium]|nr:DNA polymerase III subunit delta [Christensenellaceae bacterium]